MWELREQEDSINYTEPDRQRRKRYAFQKEKNEQMIEICHQALNIPPFWNCENKSQDLS